MQFDSHNLRDTAHANAIRESALDHVRLFSSRSRTSTYIGLNPVPEGPDVELRRLMHADKDSSREQQRQADSRARGFFARWWSSKRSWRFGLHAGLYASIAVLLSNIILLLFGLLAHDETHGGTSTIAKGDVKRVTMMSTAYHVLINFLSTILLTSSNYAMQILCAPTRQEINRAHERGQWLEIGIMSIRNLRYINRRRVILWVLLAVSSAPLHLLYNSSIFGAFAAQDYEVIVTSSFSEPLVESPTWTKLENKDWSHLYTSSRVPGYGDLHLIVDKVSFQVQVSQNWSYSLHAPGKERELCGWPAVWLHNESFPVAVQPVTNSTMFTLESQPSRFVVSTEHFLANKSQYPELEWPSSFEIKADSSDSPLFHHQICPDGGWLLSASAFHVQHAHAKINPYASRVQIAVPFLSIVIASNLVKIIVIALAVNMQSSGHIITVGDAIATFLEQPEPGTRGKCAQSKAQLCLPKKEQPAKPWSHGQRSKFMVLGGTRVWSMTIIITAFSLSIAAMTVATSTGSDMSKWGTSSKTVVPFTSTTFDSRGILIVTFLANLPQAGLSLLYFSINRICTSMCFATEWNNYGRQRKGLRVTEPSGKQRSTHFLQLPYRWAVPLTVTIGLLHWLLSQSLFLVRQEVRTRDGDLYPESTCACGYSAQSLLAFAMVFGVMLLAALHRLLEGMRMSIPPARHCSLVISAACHPPEDDIDAHLAKVQWGVIAEATSSSPGHCTFTSRPVTTMQPGGLYE